VRRVADLLTAGRSGVDLELVVEVQLVDQVGEDAFGHGAAADVAVANEKYLNHCIFPPEMLRFALFYALFWISSRVTVFRKL
jgi:hypothetical protein